MAAEAQLTPMMTQYRRIKGELPKDALLLFRLGDFYEMFFEDAQTGAQLLNLALTARNGVPMCGLPHHAANAYIGRLLKAGRKVAICDQLEDARPGKLVKREVTQILSARHALRRADARGRTQQFPRRDLSRRENLRPGAGGFDHRRFHDHGTGGRTGPARRNWNGCVRRKSFIPAKRRRCANCLVAADVNRRIPAGCWPARSQARLRGRAGSSAATTTGRLRRKPRFSPCATISRSRRSTVSG